MMAERSAWLGVSALVGRAAPLMGEVSWDRSHEVMAVRS
jgi:hypothetical protein